MEGTAVKIGTKEKTLQQKGTKSEENMFRSFMEIYLPVLRATTTAVYMAAPVRNMLDTTS
jgi:hypothetical protein